MSKVLCVFLLQTILFQVIFPTTVMALTGGPSPESTGYSPIGLDNMVSTTNGDFSYQVSLMQIGDIPLSINYSAGASVEGEASVVGVNWTPSWGAVNRSMNGIPDEFNGTDIIRKRFYTEPNWTVDLTFAADIEPFTWEPGDLFKKAGKVIKGKTHKSELKTQLAISLSYNNHSGFGIGGDFSQSRKFTSKNGLGLSADYSLGLNSQSGASINGNLSASATKTTKNNNSLSGGVNTGLGFNSRAGMTAFSMGVDLGYSVTSKDKTISEKTKTSAAIIKKTNAGKLGLGSPASYSFNSPSFITSYETSMKNMNANIGVKLGGTAFGVFGDLNVSGAYSMQWLSNKDKERDLPAYGFMYSEKAAEDENALMDFNREKAAGSFNKDIKNLPLAKETFDIYSVTAPGISGSFRTTRGDVGIVKDVLAKSSGGGGGVDGFDFGGGNLTDQGINFKGNWSNSESGAWNDKYNKVKNVFNYKSNDFTGGSDYEPFYFRQAGEFVVESDPTLIAELGGTGHTKLDLHSGSGYANSELKTSIIRGKRNSRERRNSGFQMLTAKEAKQVGLDKKIGYYKKDALGLTWTEESRVQTGDNFITKYKAHHPSQINVTGPGGKRCIFGIPSYVTNHKEVTYQTEQGNTGNSCYTGIIDYVSSEDKVRNGVNDQFYQSNEMPPYANAYMLTGVLGSDYIDRTGDGISVDDFGSATAVKYFKHSNNYGYRTPFSGAYYNEGLKSMVTDDKASYTYGQKEVWLVKEIVSRTSIAIFEYAERQDGYGAKPEGGIDKSQPLMYVKKISLYSKPEYDRHTDKTLATPIKVAHFEYNYSLCLGPDETKLPNNLGDAFDKSGFENQGGKLTLKRVYFTYGKSKKGKVSPYVFAYNSDDSKYYYGEKSSDRWGVFKENKGSVCDLKTELSNSAFPYTKQDATTDEYAGLWSLNKIETPSGGTIEVTYESDDYAYVQNKRAMQMMKISGFGNSKNYDKIDEVRLFRNFDQYVLDPSVIQDVRDILNNQNIKNFKDVLKIIGALNLLKIKDNPIFKKIKHLVKIKNHAGNYNYAYFKLQNDIPIDAVDIDRKIKEQYLTKNNGGLMDYLYFKTLVAINSIASIHQDPSNNGDIYEYIQGYAGIDSYGVNTKVTELKSDGKKYYTHGYIKLKLEELSETYGGQINPISKTAWQYTRSNLQHIAYNQPKRMEEGGGVNHLIGQFSSIFSTIVGLVTGINQRMKAQGFSNKIMAGKSFMRLYSPTYAKKGGGHRVQKLVIKDNWKTISGSQNVIDAEYGQEYDYTMIENGKVISSGVAQNEPAVGNDENPMKLPDSDTFAPKKKALAPDDRLYQEHPFGETFMPSASIVYRQVKVSSLAHNGVTNNATGYVIHENYTAYDFPVKLKKSATKSSLYGDKAFGSGTLRSLLGLKAMSIEATQSYTIETNNMHGIKKGEKIFNAVGDEISSFENKYKVEKVKNDAGKLVETSNLLNTVQTIGRDGVLKNEIIGLEMEMVVDAMMSESISQSAGININNNNSMYGPLPVVLLMFLPKYNRTETSSKTAVVVKHVNRLGVLERVIAKDLGSEVETKNLVYDRESGKVLLTETQNQFNVPVFNFQYPAYWSYREMGPSYKNLGYRLKNSTVTQLDPEYFYVGDELGIWNSSGANKYWVTDITSSAVEIKDAKGVILTGSFDELLVIRSGARNLHASPVGNITSLKSPIVNGKFALAQTNINAYPEFYSSILNASAIEFTNEWKTWCNCEYDDYEDWNLFQNGRWSGWRPKRSYVYLTNRTQSIKNANTNIREDGVFQDFSPFWLNGTAELWNKTSSDKWTWVEEISIYSPLSQELERMNALGIYSSSVFGYNRLLPTGVAGNARYQEIGEDNFEDVNFSECVNDHFSYKKYKGNNVTTRSHTGSRSLFIPQKSKVHVTKILNSCNDDNSNNIEE